MNLLNRKSLRVTPSAAGFALTFAWLTWLSYQQDITSDRCDHFARRLREKEGRRKASD